MTAPSQMGIKKIASNRKAFRDYFVLERMEAGIALQGTEVKSLREGLVTLTGGYVMVDEGAAILHDVNVAPYEFGNRFNHEATRPRRLLLHRKEIHKLLGQVSQKGFTIVPLSLYFKQGKVKVEIGLCKGKQDIDKRETIKRKEADREAERASKRR